jgi:hypothetical protein
LWIFDFKFDAFRFDEFRFFCFRFNLLFRLDLWFRFNLRFRFDLLFHFNFCNCFFFVFFLRRSDDLFHEKIDFVNKIIIFVRKFEIHVRKHIDCFVDYFENNSQFKFFVFLIKITHQIIVRVHFFCVNR